MVVVASDLEEWKEDVRYCLDFTEFGNAATLRRYRAEKRSSVPDALMQASVVHED